MIPVRKVIDAYVALVQGTDEQVGDGDAPATIDRARPWGWVGPAGRPGSPPMMGGGEPTAVVRIRVTCSAVDSQDAEAGAARRQAGWLDDQLKAVILTGAMPSGDGWRVTGRWRESTADVPEEGSHTIHADYRLHVSAVAASPGP